MCELKPLSLSSCASSDGGLVKTYLTSCTNIADIIFDANEQITGFAMTGTGQWIEYEYDTDTQQTYYNQDGERTGNKHIYNQEAYMNFSGLNNEKRLALKGITKCCCLVAVHYLGSGLAVVQGIYYNTDTGIWSTGKEKLKGIGKFNTQTGADEDIMGVTLVSKSLDPSNFTTITETALQAL